MSYDPFEDWTPATWLGSTARELYDEYLTYWGLNDADPDPELPEDWRSRFRSLHEVTESLTRALHTLRIDDQIKAEVRRFLRSGSFQDDRRGYLGHTAWSFQLDPIIRDGILLKLSLRAADDLLAGAETRSVQLLTLLADRALSPRAAAFLDRATRLYLWGFVPESIIMSASVLAAAYESRFSPEEMARLNIVKQGREYEPYEYERAAVVSGVFSRDDRELAARIRKARNDIIHNVPAPTLDGFDVLSGAATLLSRLFAPDSAD